MVLYALALCSFSQLDESTISTAQSKEQIQAQKLRYGPGSPFLTHYSAIRTGKKSMPKTTAQCLACLLACVHVGPSGRHIVTATGSSTQVSLVRDRGCLGIRSHRPMIMSRWAWALCTQNRSCRDHRVAVGRHDRGCTPYASEMSTIGRTLAFLFCHSPLPVGLSIPPSHDGSRVCAHAKHRRRHRGVGGYFLHTVQDDLYTG